MPAPGLQLVLRVKYQAEILPMRRRSDRRPDANSGARMPPEYTSANSKTKRNVRAAL